MGEDKTNMQRALARDKARVRFADGEWAYGGPNSPDGERRSAVCQNGYDPIA